jgi:xylulokinase
LDVGTTGCKAVLFSTTGDVLASGYTEYNITRKQAGYAELDSKEVWQSIKQTIKQTTSASASGTGSTGKGASSKDPITAISIASMGEAVVPVSRDREILGPSIMNFDIRGEEYLPRLEASFSDKELYDINGNTLANQFGVTKLMWIKNHRPELYEKTYKFLLWSGFVAFMLGAEPFVDYSLANRTLLFDLQTCDWSTPLLDAAGLDREKLPDTVQSGEKIGTISAAVARELGLPEGTAILAGAHDQCANAVGCGVITPGSAMYGMGTFVCIAPIFAGRKDTGKMLEAGLNTEHHAVKDLFVSFIYNMGGSIIKWFRDTYAGGEHEAAAAEGKNIYPDLFAEVPEGKTRLTVLPHFTPMGPPDFIDDSLGAIVGLNLETSRGEVLKSIIESNVFSLKECIELLPETDMEISNYRVVGGGSKSDIMVQTCCDILETPFVRPKVTEAGALGAAVLAGRGTGVFSSFEEGVEAMVVLGDRFEPDSTYRDYYREKFEQYKKLYPALEDFIGGVRAIT